MEPFSPIEVDLICEWLQIHERIPHLEIRELFKLLISLKSPSSEMTFLLAKLYLCEGVWTIDLQNQLEQLKFEWSPLFETQISKLLKKIF